MIRFLVIIAVVLFTIGCSNNSNPTSYVEEKEMSSKLVVDGLSYNAVEAVCINDSLYIDYLNGKLKIKTVEMFPLTVGACKINVEFQFGISRFTTGDLLITEIKDGYISGGIYFRINDQYGTTNATCTFDNIKVREK